jgi:transposase
MLRLPSTVFVATAPVDLRLSFDRLAGLVRDQLDGDPRGDALFLFHNRRLTHVKLLWHDGSGYWQLYKRLDRRRFRIPLAIPAQTARVQISSRELQTLLEGIDMTLIRAARRVKRQGSTPSNSQVELRNI